MNETEILGLGSDIVELARLKKAIDRHGLAFIQRVFTKEEIDYCLSFANSLEHFAGRFAAKEAFVKAVGTGFSSQITFKDISIINTSSGKPEVILTSKVKEILGSINVYLTISHTQNYAIAVSLILKKFL